jgi:energy-coupling factor transporter ATP-binding protein EcfA2
VPICDEPVNGLDPQGILWIRTLLRGLAAEGRTVFVSSHLVTEMALTAYHLIVIVIGTSGHRLSDKHAPLGHPLTTLNKWPSAHPIARYGSGSQLVVRPRPG